MIDKEILDWLERHTTRLEMKATFGSHIFSGGPIPVRQMVRDLSKQTQVCSIELQEPQVVRPMADPGDLGVPENLLDGGIEDLNLDSDLKEELYEALRSVHIEQTMAFQIKKATERTGSNKYIAEKYVDFCNNTSRMLQSFEIRKAIAIEKQKERNKERESWIGRSMKEAHELLEQEGVVIPKDMADYILKPAPDKGIFRTFFERF